MDVCAGKRMSLLILTPTAKKVRPRAIQAAGVRCQLAELIESTAYDRSFAAALIMFLTKSAFANCPTDAPASAMGTAQITRFE